MEDCYLLKKIKKNYRSSSQVLAGLAKNYFQQQYNSKKPEKTTGHVCRPSFLGYSRLYDLLASLLKNERRVYNRRWSECGNQEYRQQNVAITIRQWENLDCH